MGFLPAVAAAKILTTAFSIASGAFLLRGKKVIYEKQIATRHDTPVHHGDFMLGVLARLTVQRGLKEV